MSSYSNYTTNYKKTVLYLTGVAAAVEAEMEVVVEAVVEGESHGRLSGSSAHRVLPSVKARTRRRTIGSPDVTLNPPAGHHHLLSPPGGGKESQGRMGNTNNRKSVQCVNLNVMEKRRKKN